MDAKKTSYGSDARGLAEMIGMGTGGRDEEMIPAEARESYLAQQLGSTLPLTREQAAKLADVAMQFREGLPLGGRAVGEALLDERTELAELVEIKEHGKAMSVSGETEIERDAGLAIYYAAIASALLYHGTRITAYSYAALVDAFGRLIDKRWMDPKLARHLAKARKKCKRKAR